MNRHSSIKFAKNSESNDNQLDNHLIQFQQYLISQNYAESTIKLYVRCISIFIDIVKTDKIVLATLDEIEAVRLIAKSSWIKKRWVYATHIVKRFARHLINQGVGKPPLPLTAKEIARAELRQDYEAYLLRQRGLSEKTIFQSWCHSNRFLEFHFGEDTGDLSQITARDIVKFLQHLTTRTPPLRDKTLSSHLRNFFRYIFKAGKTQTNLALAIPSVAQRYGARLPRHLSSEQIDVLLNAIQNNTPIGRRNYTMVLLLARLGLRPPEVIAIQIDDIVWRSGEIVVRGKGGRHDRLPLPSDVGEALANYIRNDRISSSRMLFVTERPPHRPFKDSQVLNRILKDAFAKTGMTPAAPYIGSHILRHSLATNLVQCGASLDEISDMLRHRSRATTMIYAKQDIDGLRSIAQSWPILGGAK